ncbi:CHASE domain-containing protein, partial [Propionivibrio sp.]
MAEVPAPGLTQRRTPAQMKWSNWYLTTLKLAVALLLTLLIVLFWLLRQNAANEQRSTLIADVLWLEQSVNFHLEGNAEQFQQLALDLALTPEKNKDALFRLRSQHLLKNNPELQQLLWLDAATRMLDALPTKNLPRLGYAGLGEETQTQAIERASKLGKPVYTEAYQLSDSPQFEVFFPIFQNSQYRGSLVGVYSLNTLLKQLVPWWFTEKYQVRILDANGNTLVSKSKVSNDATT